MFTNVHCYKKILTPNKHLQKFVRGMDFLHRGGYSFFL